MAHTLLKSPERIMNARHIPPVLFSLLMFLSFRDGFAQTAKKPPIFSSDLSGGDMQFLVSASQQGQLQAVLGALAGSHAESADVKAFGITLAKENAVQNEQIKLMAIRKHFTLPENPEAEKNPSAVKLQKLQGLKFDKAFILEMLTQEQNYADIFERATLSQDPDIKAFAAATLPVIKQHLAFLGHSTGKAPSGTPTPHFRVNVGDPGASGTGTN
jgi:putative membrane protein